MHHQEKMQRGEDTAADEILEKDIVIWLDTNIDQNSNILDSNRYFNSRTIPQRLDRDHVCTICMR